MISSTIIFEQTPLYYSPNSVHAEGFCGGKVRISTSVLQGPSPPSLANICAQTAKFVRVTALPFTVARTTFTEKNSFVFLHFASEMPLGPDAPGFPLLPAGSQKDWAQEHTPKNSFDFFAT